MSDYEKELLSKILNYLYDNRSKSPQSLAKIKQAVGSSDGRGDIRILKASLDFLVTNKLITKQKDRGNYKIDDKGIETITSYDK